MINKYIWDNYLKSGGNDIVEMFRRNLIDEFTEEYPDKIKEFHSTYCPSKYIIDETHELLVALFTDITNGILPSGCFSIAKITDGTYTINNILKVLYDNIISDCSSKSADKFSEFAYFLNYYSTFLFIEFPDAFIPYYFTYNFNVFKQIADEFEIQLPDIPAKKDYEKRFFYYGEICNALIDFRKENGMSPFELCAFLYDFAPKYIDGLNYIIPNLPEPKSAFFIGGSKDDIFLDENAEQIVPWQCSPDTKAGDMIVMYLRTPISSVDSIWRSVCIGFNDPFFYYYRCTYIGHRTAIKRITQKQLQTDKILGKMPIIRKNMQGINGVELKPSEYNHLVDISYTDVMKLEYVLENSDTEFTCEKDVENKLIKQLLKKLGYSENEYEPQLYIQIGNHNNALIPDFVILPLKINGHHSAFATIEAKLKISNLKEFEQVKIQARSYAKQLSTKYSIIASKDGIWISSFEDDYSQDIFTATWDELGNADTFSAIFKLIGNGSQAKMLNDEIKRKLSGRAANYLMFKHD